MPLAGLEVYQGHWNIKENGPLKINREIGKFVFESHLYGLEKCEL